MSICMVVLAVWYAWIWTLSIEMDFEKSFGKILFSGNQWKEDVVLVE